MTRGSKTDDDGICGEQVGSALPGNMAADAQGHRSDVANLKSEFKVDLQPTDQTTKKNPERDMLPGVLGSQLKAAYGAMLSAPVPDKFLQLIEQLDKKPLDIGLASGETDQ